MVSGTTTWVAIPSEIFNGCLSAKRYDKAQLNQNNPTISNHSIDFLEKESPIGGSMCYEIYENN